MSAAGWRSPLEEGGVAADAECRGLSDRQAERGEKSRDRGDKTGGEPGFHARRTGHALLLMKNFEK